MCHVEDRHSCRSCPGLQTPGARTCLITSQAMSLSGEFLPSIPEIYQIKGERSLNRNFINHKLATNGRGHITTINKICQAHQ